jgi:hypothetical protein
MRESKARRYVTFFYKVPLCKGGYRGIWPEAAALNPPSPPFSKGGKVLCKRQDLRITGIHSVVLLEQGILAYFPPEFIEAVLTRELPV